MSSRGRLAVVYLGLSAWMFSQEPVIRRGGGPGIVGLELAGSTERVDEILAGWGPEGQAAARRSLLVDYLVLATYAPLLAGLCGGPVAAAPYAAAVCDIGENTALLAILNGRRRRLPALAKGMATAKFALLGISVAAAARGAGCGRVEVGATESVAPGWRGCQLPPPPRSPRSAKTSARSAGWRSCSG
jgi:hypothetical protein